VSRVRIYLVEPEAQGRVSGGYLYNQRLAEAGTALSIVSTSVAALASSLGALALAPQDWLLLDSLFLEPGAFAAFVAARQGTGCQLGLMLHAFPSFVERADRGDKARLVDARPSELELGLLRELDAVVCPGPYGPRVLAESGVAVPTVSCPPGAVVAHELLPFAEARAAAPLEGLPLQVLSVGNVTRGKGYQDALIAFEHCKDLDVCWQIVGSLDWDPAWVEALQQEAQRLGLAERIEFSGQLSPTATVQRYLASDVFLLGSFTENHPLVLLEARAYGLPVVAYRVGGVPDIVAEAGLLASPFDVCELGAQLRRVLSDSNERARLRSLALGAVGEAVAWSESAERLYQQLQALFRAP